MSDEIRTQEDIHSKGFNIKNGNKLQLTDYGSIKIGNKTLEDAIMELRDSTFSRNPVRKYNKNDVMQAIMRKDIFKLRNISEYFYENDGIYARVCDYFAYMYRYDWYVVP